MILINDNDTPITVAKKIIMGTKPYNPTPAMKALTKAITGEESETQDMFDLDEIKEIADYLIVYYEKHKYTGD